MGEHMAVVLDGIGFKNMLDYAVRNLNLHCKLVNQLNVFPVPDGDTGTNMVVTIHKALLSVPETLTDLPDIAKKFAGSIVFEARGNSGVIVSQFFKGLSEHLGAVEQISGALLIDALEKGVKYAYSAVANPVEGTMLTVVREATEAVRAEHCDEADLHKVVASLVGHAKRSLDHTPELLAVLKESGVVDSGGAGVVYLFEGMLKYLNGEELDTMEDKSEHSVIDYDAFGRDSTFEFGYCTELLLQLLNGREAFEAAAFKEALGALGDSLVVSIQNDKVRVHIHSHRPEEVFALCHKYGEFLTCKIENMTVQHTDLAKRILVSETPNQGAFSVVAVAYDPEVQKLFLEMGADVCLFSEENVCAKDYLEAFEKTSTEHILVFPNSSDAILSAMQAKNLYTAAKVHVINSRGIAECYAALPAVEFSSENVERVVDDITKTVNNLYVVSVARRKSTVTHGDQAIYRNEFYSFSGKELISISKSLLETVLSTVSKVLRARKKQIITLFYKTSLEAKLIEEIEEKIYEIDPCVELFTVATDSLRCEMTLSFE